MMGTIMIRPSFDQIGRSRSRPTGRRRRDETGSRVVGRLLTSPPSEPAPYGTAGTRDRPTLLGQTSEIPPCRVARRKPRSAATPYVLKRKKRPFGSDFRRSAPYAGRFTRYTQMIAADKAGHGGVLCHLASTSAEQL